MNGTNQKENKTSPETLFYIREIYKLKTEQQYLERCQLSAVNAVKVISKTAVDDSYRELQFEFKNQQNELVQEMENIIGLKTFLKTNITNVHKLKQIDVLKCKDVENLDRSMKELKNTINKNIFDLCSSEHILNEELSQIKNQIESWKNTPSQKNKITSVSSVYEIKGQEKYEFYRFLQKNGGHEGGWTIEDHNIFLNVFHKYHKNIDKMILEIQNILPDVSKEEILVHLEWFHQYNELRRKHKEIIKEWKNQKQKNESSDVKISEKETLNKKKKEPRNNTNEIQDKIMIWKKEKLIQRETQMKQLETVKEKQKNEEAKKKLTQLQKKDKVHKWKMIKMHEENAKKMYEQQQRLKEHIFKASEANKFIKNYQKQDEIYIQQKLKSKLSRSAEKQMKGSNSSLTLNIERDPLRVMRATEQWIRRSKPNDSSNNTRLSSDLCIYNIPKLKTPNWRRNLTCM